MKKKVLAGLLVSVFTIAALAGCGGSSASKPAETKAAETTAAAEGEVLAGGRGESAGEMGQQRQEGGHRG